MIKDVCKQSHSPVLIIEDDLEWANQLSAVLQVMDMTRVQILSDPGFVVQLTGEFKPLVIFMGLSMACHERYQLIDQIKGAFPNLPLIVIGNIDVDTAVACMRHGADDYLTRPLYRRELHSSLQRVQNETAAHANEQHMNFVEAIRHVDELPYLKDMPGMLIDEAFRRHNGVLKYAAEELGISPQAICNRRRRNSQAQAIQQYSGAGIDSYDARPSSTAAGAPISPA